MNKKLGLANFGKNFGKSTSSNVAKVIKSLSEIVNYPSLVFSRFFDIRGNLGNTD